MNILNSKIISKSAIFAIIISRFNNFINDHLLNGTIDTLTRIGQVKKENIFIFYVPGTYEIPIIAKILCEKKKYDAIITLGTIIKGKTPHYKSIVNPIFSNLSNISIKNKIPILLGILITNTVEQAIERAGTKLGNKGSETAYAALEMINLIKKIK
ncbi:6,7-dimethyl-8-ribityllumazine synthase [Buchnera aphidicola (Mindarus keteleerifoliae)]|uniref:6,7-dimethyl-8-ribityllumazine synthase n=1 Tax=Buchnera aphidicola TaxID=9 RepID=UPI0031B71752